MAVIYLCPVHNQLSCDWEGQASDIKQHFEQQHGNLLFRSNSIEIVLDALPEHKLLYIEEEIYLMQNYLENGRLEIKLRYLGSSTAASKLQYDVIITVNQIAYKYDSSRYFSCVLPKVGGWEINIDSLSKFHGQFETIICTIIIEENTINSERKLSDISLKINNSFIEKNVCDETEAHYLEALSLVEDRIEDLKKQKESEEELQNQQKAEENLEFEFSLRRQNRTSGDFFDRESVLNLSILERPFSKTQEEHRNAIETLNNISEEFNLSCSTCKLDMLPPIYLCTNGHNVCAWCRSKACKICNFAVTNSRNTELENISRTILHNCRYSSEGCSEKLPYTEVRAHEAKCYFCKYKCMSDDCPYEGKFSHFVNHLKIMHSSVKIGFSTKNEFPKNSEMYVLNRSIGIFYCTSQSKLENGIDFIIWRVTFCGPKERHFFCDISFKGSKYKEPIILKRKENFYESKKPITELKKNKAKEKYAVLTIASYDT